MTFLHYGERPVVAMEIHVVVGGASRRPASGPPALTIEETPNWSAGREGGREGRKEGGSEGERE